MWETFISDKCVTVLVGVTIIRIRLGTETRHEATEYTHSHRETSVFS